MTQAEMMRVGIALAAALAAYKFLPNASAKAAALGVAGVIIGKQLPYVKEAL